MTTQRAIILAAGAGRRLLPLTADRPKVLVEVCGEPILLRMLRQLSSLGVAGATLVVGDRSDQVRDVVAAGGFRLKLDWVVNQDYATTNNSWSLALAADALRRGGLLIEGDVVADDSVLAELVRTPESTCWLVRPFSAGMDGAFLQADRSGRLRHLAIVPKGTPPDNEGFKSMGLLKLSQRYAGRLADWLLTETANGHRDRYFDMVVAEHLDEDAPVLVSVNHGFWTEIDTPDDLAGAAAGLGAGA